LIERCREVNQGRAFEQDDSRSYQGAVDIEE